jgi:hypothetical protein
LVIRSADQIKPLLLLPPPPPPPLLLLLLLLLLGQPQQLLGLESWV